MSDTREIKNAVIEATSLGMEDHGILTAFVYLSYGGSGQGFGGYALDGCPINRTANSKRVPTRACGLFIARVCEVVGVEKWEELKGKSCRVVGTYNKIEGIGHYLRDNWFYPEAELNALI